MKARIRADQRMARYENKLPTKRLLSEIEPEVEVEPSEPINNRKQVALEIDVVIGGKVLAFHFDAPSFLGTVPASQVTESGIRALLLKALGTHFGKLT